MRGLGQRRLLRGWSALSLGLCRRHMWTGCPYAAPTSRPITYPATPPPSPMTSISSPSRHHEPTVIFASYQPIPKSATALSRTARTAPRSTSLPTKKNGLRGMKCPTTVAVPTRKALALGAPASTGESLSSKDIMNSSSAVGLRPDSLHDLLEIGTLVAPPREDLADLVPFRLRDFLHLPPLLDGLAQVEPPSGPGRGVGDGPHRDRLRPERGEGRDQDDPDVAGRRRQAQDNPEDIDDPVLAPEDEVGQDAGLRVRRAFHRLVCVHGGPSRGTGKPFSAVTRTGLRARPALIPREFYGFEDFDAGRWESGGLVVRGFGTLVPFSMGRFTPCR